MNLCSAFEASKSNHHLHPPPTFPKIMAPPGQIEWCWKMTQNGRAYLNSRRQEPNEDIVLKHFLLSDIRLNIISWKFQVDISYSYGDMAFWNVYFKDQQYISRPSDYVYSAFYRFRWSAFRILQIPVVRIPSFRVLQIPQYTDSIPFRILQIPFHSAEYRRPGIAWSIIYQCALMHWFAHLRNVLKWSCEIIWLFVSYALLLFSLYMYTFHYVKHFDNYNVNLLCAI